MRFAEGFSRAIHPEPSNEEYRDHSHVQQNRTEERERYGIALIENVQVS